jgi:hypothetical protein
MEEQVDQNEDKSAQSSRAAEQRLCDPRSTVFTPGNRPSMERLADHCNNIAEVVAARAIMLSTRIRSLNRLLQWAVAAMSGLL